MAVKGKLMPTSEENVEALSTGKIKSIHIYPRMEINVTGTITSPNRGPFELSFGIGGDVFVKYRGRDIMYKMEDIIEDAVTIVDKEVEA